MTKQRTKDQETSNANTDAVQDSRSGCPVRCIDLFALFGRTYHVTYEPPASVRKKDPWLAVISAKHGHVYVHGGDELGFSTNTRGAIAKRLAALPFTAVMQDGDDGVNVVFNVAHFAEVARIVKPRRNRRLSKKQLAANRERLAKFRQDHPDWRPGQRLTREKPIAQDENPAQKREQDRSDEFDAGGTAQRRTDPEKVCVAQPLKNRGQLGGLDSTRAIRGNGQTTENELVE